MPHHTPFRGWQRSYQDFCGSGGSLVPTVSSSSGLWIPHTLSLFCTTVSQVWKDRVCGGWEQGERVGGLACQFHLTQCLAPFPGSPASILPARFFPGVFRPTSYDSYLTQGSYLVLCYLGSCHYSGSHVLLGPFRSICLNKVSLYKRNVDSYLIIIKILLKQKLR